MHDPDRQMFPPGSIDETFGDQSSVFFEKIVSIAPSILYVFDLVEMRNIWVNRSMFLGLGYTAEEVTDLGSNLLQVLMHPDDMDRYPAHFATLKTLGPKDVARFEYRMMGKDGSWHWLASEEMAFSYADDGSVSQIVGSAHDISEARLREDRINLLVREMNHRIKNLFAVVQSMISLTSKTKRDAPADEAFEVIKGRVNALAISQSLSLPSVETTLTSSRELVEKVLNPYAGVHDIRIDGSNPFLTPDQSNSLAMILHELATNAIKYGALSESSGSLTIQMETRETGESDPELHLTWIENSPSKITPPDSQKASGFGSRLIKRSVEQISGTIDLDWRETGLVTYVTVPITAA